MKNLYKDMIDSMVEAGVPAGHADTVSRICNTSVDDGRYAVRSCRDISVLKSALAYETGTTNRTTMVRMLKRRISALLRAKAHGGRA